MKSGGLGSLPKGLEWINQNPQKNEAQTTSKPLVVQQVQQVTPVASTPITPVLQPATNNQSVLEKPQFVASAKHKTSTKRSVESASAGLPDGYTRATFIIKQDHVDRLKALAYVNKTSIKDLVDQAMTKFLKDKDVATILMEAVKGTETASEHSENK